MTMPSPPDSTHKFDLDRLVSLVFAVTVLVISLGVTYGIWHSARRDAAKNLRAEFDFEVRGIIARIKQRLSAYENVLRGTHAYFAGSEHVNRAEFKAFVSSLELEKTYPGIKGVGVSWIVTEKNRLEHIIKLRREGFTDYAILPEGEREIYAPVILREPFTGGGRLALGFDQYSEPTRRAAMDKARDSGSIAISHKLLLMTDAADGKHVSFLMIYPMYKNNSGRSLATVEERRASIVGWIYVAVRMNDLMAGMSGERAREIDVELFDSETATRESLMYDSDDDPLNLRTNNPNPLKATHRIDTGCHAWTLAIQSLPAFEARIDHGKPTLIAWAGIILSLLLAMLTFLLSSGRQRAIALATRMTDDLRQNEAHFRFITETAQALFWMCDSNKKCTWFNKVWLDFTGRNLTDEQGFGWSAGVHPDDLPQCLETFTNHFDQRQPFSMEYRLRRHDGEYRWILDTGKPFYDSKGNFEGYIGSCFDITERKKAEEELQLASMVYKTSGEAIAVTDASGNFLAANPAFTLVTGYTQEEIIGHTPRLFKSGHHNADFYQAMWHALTTTGQWQGEIWNRRKNGEIYPEWLSISSTFNEDGSIHRRVAMFSDITKKKKLEELLWQQANIDLLTGLPNRRMFLDRIEQEIQKSKRSGEQMALLFLDLDHFKDVNDTLGHDMGDLLLKMAADRINDCVRKTDTVARLGGDEFTVILAELRDPSDVERAANKILQKLAEPFPLGSELAYISSSIGITVYPDDAVQAEDLLKNADQAMYAAKQEGRSRYQYFMQSMQEAAQARVRLINDLRYAISGNQLRVCYQPIVELATGSIYKAEALVRWQHPVRGLVSPAEFIPLAEDTGLIIDIGDWVFKETARQVKRLRELHDPRFQISVNKSPIQFRKDHSTYKSWLECLRQLDIPGNGIIIEITESLLMDMGSLVSDKLTAFRASGMQISLDDFGTGYSSLSYLKNLDLDYLKIDQSFVRNLTAESDDMALCEAIIVMAHKLGIKVIAEGVETIEQRNLLASAGCDYAQGYLFSRPVPADELESMLAAESHIDAG